MTYGRLFAKGDGASGLSDDAIPKHLEPVHDELIELRNRRYAHNASHETVKSGINVYFDDDGFEVRINMSLGIYIGGRNEWEELITFIERTTCTRDSDKDSQPSARKDRLRVEVPHGTGARLVWQLWKSKPLRRPTT